MKIDEIKVVVLEAESGNELYSVNDPTVCGQVISLGKHDTVDNWKERPITTSIQQGETLRSLAFENENYSVAEPSSNLIGNFTKKIKCILSSRKK
jgi:hypothetical protein